MSRPGSPTLYEACAYEMSGETFMEATASSPEAAKAFLEERLKSCKIPLTVKVNKYVASSILTSGCRSLMIQLQNPRTDGEWYAILEMYDMLGTLGEITPSPSPRPLRRLA